jgi:hypothetical protein
MRERAIYAKRSVETMKDFSDIRGASANLKTLGHDLREVSREYTDGWELFHNGFHNSIRNLLKEELKEEYHDQIKNTFFDHNKLTFSLNAFGIDYLKALLDSYDFLDDSNYDVLYPIIGTGGRITVDIKNGLVISDSRPEFPEFKRKSEEMKKFFEPDITSGARLLKKESSIWNVNIFFPKDRKSTIEHLQKKIENANRVISDINELYKKYPEIIKILNERIDEVERELVRICLLYDNKPYNIQR